MIAKSYWTEEHPEIPGSMWRWACARGHVASRCQLKRGELYVLRPMAEGVDELLAQDLARGKEHACSLIMVHIIESEVFNTRRKLEATEAALKHWKEST